MMHGSCYSENSGCPDSAQNCSQFKLKLSKRNTLITMLFLFSQVFGMCFLGMDFLNLHWFRLMCLVLVRAAKARLINVKSKLKLHFRFQEDDEEEVFYDAQDLDVSHFSPI